MTIETDTRCTLCGRCSLWCTCIGTFAVPCVDAGMHPRRGQGETQSSRQDGGEGLGFETTHNGSNHIQERKYHA